MDLLTELTERRFVVASIAYLGTKFSEELQKGLGDDVDIVVFKKLDELQAYISRQSMLHVPDTIILEVGDDLPPLLRFVRSVKNNPITNGIDIILLGFKGNKEQVRYVFLEYVSDIYFYPFNLTDIEERLKILYKFKRLSRRSGDVAPKSLDEYRMPWTKRLFDVVVAGTVLLLLSPLMLLIALLIKLDSKGPVIYKSKRAGTGYRIFDFYKFRSMRVNADKELARLAAQNQYAASGGNAAFVKIKNDPRITRFGAFLRNTSLDELPQLFNVLKGDMSLVGNRPLPLYEAQQLTSDDWAMRFLGPAGITGLWQVTKRGRAEMSDEERRRLDNEYAKHFSFWMDLRILIKTIPALFQSETV